MICEQAGELRDGDLLEVEPLTGEIRNLTSGKKYHCKPLPENIMTIIEHGGLLGDLDHQLSHPRG